MSVAELADVVSGGAVWTGLVYLGIRAVVSIVGTRSQRMQEKNWSNLNDRLKDLAKTYDRQLDRIATIHERAIGDTRGNTEG